MHGDLSTPRRGYCLCIGAAKSGTTWLYEQLKDSPEMHFAPEKELHYFFSRYGAFDRLPPAARFEKLREFMDRAQHNFNTPMPESEFARKFTFFQRNMDWYQSFAQGPATLSWYRRLFNDAGPQQYACDFSPSTSKIGIDGVHAIRELSENVKLIYILRNPMDRLWSHIKFHAQFMGCFEDIKGFNSRQLARYAREEQLPQDGLYGTTLQRYLEVFDRKDILVLDFAEIRTDPNDLLRRVCDFLEIKQPQLTEGARSAVNASQKMDMPEGLLDGFKKEMRTQVEILESLGCDFASRWREKLER